MQQKHTFFSCEEEKWTSAATWRYFRHYCSECSSRYPLDIISFDCAGLSYGGLSYGLVGSVDWLVLCWYVFAARAMEVR